LRRDAREPPRVLAVRGATAPLGLRRWDCAVGIAPLGLRRWDCAVGIARCKPIAESAVSDRPWASRNNWHEMLLQKSRKLVRCFQLS
jgi:hypothetical protein